MNKQAKSALVLISFLIIALIAFGIISSRERNRREKDLKIEALEVFLPDKEVSGIFDDGKKLWIGGRDGILWVDRKTGEALDSPLDDIDLDMSYAGDIVSNEDGEILIGHNDGLSVFSKEGKLISNLSAPKICAGRINDIEVDGKQVTLVSPKGASVLKKNGGEWEVLANYNKSNGLAEDNNAVVKKFGDTYFFGSYLSKDKGGLSLLKDGKFSYLNMDDGLPHRDINSLISLDEKQILVATGHLNRGGLALLEKGDNRYFVKKVWTKENGIPGPKIRWLFIDSMDKLWITTESDGLLLIDLKNLEKDNLEGLYLNQKSGLSDNEIKRIVETKDYFWLGGRYGLTRIDKASFIKK